MNKENAFNKVFMEVTEETLEKSELRYYCGGEELKVGDLICGGFTIGYANLNGNQPSSFTHDEASHINFLMFVLDKRKGTLWQLYKQK